MLSASYYAAAVVRLKLGRIVPLMGTSLVWALFSPTLMYSTAASAQSTHVVQTLSGPIAGVHGAKGVTAYLGIPYAAPPVGALRWAVPGAPEPWTEPLEATAFGPDCPQVKELGDFGSPSTTEDCLYLNIYVPEGAQNRPVMLWIHGGESTGSSASYDGTALAAEQDVVVVTINYRIGVLGDLIHPALDGEGASTHYGIRDQQFAMRWVRDNIASFGGDPSNVTLFGESTGATDIVLHIISPDAADLFDKAILQSPARYFRPLTPLEDARSMGLNFSAAVGCNNQSSDCLRQISVKDLLMSQGGFSADCCAVLPVADGHLLNSSIQDAIRSGQFNQVPILSMTTRDENRWFEAFFGEASGGAALTSAEYSKQMVEAYGGNAKEVLAAYPLEAYDSPSGARAAASGDNSAICQPRSFNMDASQFVPVFALEFADSESPGILPPVSFPLLASHTHELQYLFPGWKGVSEAELPPLTDDQRQLAANMRRIWAHFATAGALPPDLAPGVTGPDEVLSLEVPEIRVISDADFAASHNCALWDRLRGWTPLYRD